MNREEAKKKIWENKSINTIGKVECDAAIDHAYDFFEKKVCEKCIYCLGTKNSGYYYCDKLEIEIPSDIAFGCTEMKPVRMPDDIQD